MTKHTPGPWAYDNDDNNKQFEPGETCGCVRGGPDDYIVATVWTDTETLAADGPANARLIAIAPDMYEAAKALLEAEDALDASMARDVIPEGDEEFSRLLAARDEAKTKMRAALSKAEGAP